MTREQQKEKTQFMQLVKKAAAKNALLIDNSYCPRCFKEVREDCRNTISFDQGGPLTQWCPNCYSFVPLNPINF